MSYLSSGQLSQTTTSKWWVLSGLWLVYGSFGVTVTSIAPLVGPIERDLGMSHAAMGSIMGAWQLVYIAAAVPGGILLDRIGGRYALLLGVLTVALSGFGRSLADDYWGLLAAVMVLGIGGPIISSGAPKLVTEHFQGSQRGLAMGIYMTGPALGSIASLSLTHSWLMPMFDQDWRAVLLFWTAVTLICAFVWFVISWLFLPDHKLKPQAQRVSQLRVMGSLLRMPAVRVLLLMSVGVFLFNHGLNNWLIELLRQGGMTFTQAGYWATIPTAVGILSSLIIPRLATPNRRFAILIGLCGLALLASILLRFSDGLPLSVGLVLQGVARSTLMTVLILTLVELPGIGDARTGVASGMFFSAAEIGGVLGPLGMGLLYDASGGFETSLTALSYVASLLMLGAIFLRRAAKTGQEITLSNESPPPGTT